MVNKYITLLNILKIFEQKRKIKNDVTFGI